MTLARSPDNPIQIALVNNMPDQALAATQSQFERVVRAGADGRPIQWRCYALSGQPRSETARRFLEHSHEDIEALYRRGADALIVTGAEPRAENLRDEPFWPELQRLVDWARVHTASAIWSCLAAHAAALHLDGVERRRMTKKLSGVYAVMSVESWRGGQTKQKMLVPHSRYNDLPRDELEARGYCVSSHSPEIGVDAFWRREPSLFVFLQGHPEYEAETLMKEYRRDVLRYVSRERGEYPDPPVGLFGARTLKSLERLKAEATSVRGGAIAERLSAVLSANKFDAKWASDSVRLYRDWLLVITQERRPWSNSA
jgi:homoserine O-succinyltransferase